jgi:hypothetical protein
MMQSLSQNNPAAKLFLVQKGKYMKCKNPVIAIFMLFTFSLVCFAQNPTVDAGFVPAISGVSSTISVGTVIQPDGKIIAFDAFIR